MYVGVSHSLVRNRKSELRHTNGPSAWGASNDIKLIAKCIFVAFVIVENRFNFTLFLFITNIATMHTWPSDEVSKVRLKRKESVKFNQSRNSKQQ